MNNDSILDEIYESRIEEICRLSKEEREVYNESKVKIDDFLKNISEDIRTQVEEFIEAKIEELNYINGITNKKYYKAGLSDGIKIINETFS